MKAKPEPWPDKDEMKYSADLWEAFCNFESCVRDTNSSESFRTFFARWQARLETIEVLGVMYPDHLLVMKLTYACHLDLTTVLTLLNTVHSIKDVQDRSWRKAKDILCEIKHEVEPAIDTFEEIESKDGLLNGDVIKSIEDDKDLSKVLDNVIVSFDNDNVLADVIETLHDSDYEPDVEKFESTEHHKVNETKKCAERKRKLKTGCDESFPKSCDKCGIENVNKEHFEGCHGGHYCGPCVKSFTSKAKLDLHIKKHIPEKCSKCGDVLASHGALRRHLRTSSCAEKKECPVCNLKFNPTTFKKHLMTHSEEGNSQVCPREGCSQSFIHQFLLDQHVSKVHDKVRNFECDICKEKFFSEEKMKFHKKCIHEDLPLFCERCGKSGVGVPRQVMQTHINRCAYQFECKLCGVKFPNKEKYDKHVSNHTEHTCQKCNKVLPTIKKYRQHLAWSSCAERVMCKYCGQYFSPTTIKKHEGKHKSNQNIQCPREGCDECFHNQIRLQRHLEKHDGIRNFTCDVCSKGFFTAKDVKRHKDIIHLKMEGKHECGICGKKYHAPCKLEIHIKSHTGEKGFPCNLCEKAFTTKPRLKRHIAINHEGMKPEVRIWSCQLCSKQFTKQYNLTRHYKSVHKVDHQEIYGTLNTKPVKLEET